MDIGQAFGFVFEDEEWIKKTLLGSVILLVPVLGIFVLMGYTIAIIRNVKAGDPRPLPAWDNLGGYFMDGLMFCIAYLLYSLPFLILICPIMLTGLLPAVAGDNQDLAAILAGVSGLLSMGIGCLAVLYGILLTLLAPVLYIRYAETGEIRACLRFGEVFRYLFANIGSILVSILLVWVASMVIVPIASMLTLGLLALPASFWLTVFTAYLFGQIGRKAEISVT